MTRRGVSSAPPRHFCWPIANYYVGKSYHAWKCFQVISAGVFYNAAYFPSARGIVPRMPPKSIGLLTTNEAAECLGVSRRRVLQLIGEGRLPTEKAGDMHLINPADLAAVRVRKPGRPPKVKAAPKARKPRK